MKRSHLVTKGSVLSLVIALSGATYEAKLTSVSTPDNVEMRYLFAYSSWRRGDLDAAIEALEVVLEARPAHRQARLLLEKLRE